MPHGLNFDPRSHTGALSIFRIHAACWYCVYAYSLACKYHWIFPNLVLDLPLPIGYVLDLLFDLFAGEIDRISQAILDINANNARSEENSRRRHADASRDMNAKFAVMQGELDSMRKDNTEQTEENRVRRSAHYTHQQNQKFAISLYVTCQDVESSAT